MQILKTIVDHGAMPVVEFHGEGGEEIQVRLRARSPADDEETLIEVAKVMMLHAAAFDPPIETSERSAHEPKTRMEHRARAYLPDGHADMSADPVVRNLSDDTKEQ